MVAGKMAGLSYTTCRPRLCCRASQQAAAGAQTQHGGDAQRAQQQTASQPALKGLGKLTVEDIDGTRMVRVSQVMELMQQYETAKNQSLTAALTSSDRARVLENTLRAVIDDRQRAQQSIEKLERNAQTFAMEARRDALETTSLRSKLDDTRQQINAMRAGIGAAVAVAERNVERSVTARMEQLHAPRLMTLKSNADNAKQRAQHADETLMRARGGGARRLADTARSQQSLTAVAAAEAAEAAVDRAADIALRTAGAAQHCLEQQAGVTAALETVRDAARAADEREHRAEMECVALRCEATELRQRLQEMELAIETSTVALERSEEAAQERRREASDAAKRHMDDATAAFATLIASERARADAASDNASQLQLEMALLQEQADDCEADMAAAEAAVVIANEAVNNAQQQLATRLQELDRSSQERIDAHWQAMSKMEVELREAMESDCDAAVSAALDEVSRLTQERDVATASYIASLQHSLSLLTSERDFWINRVAQLRAEMQALERDAAVIAQQQRGGDDADAQPLLVRGRGRLRRRLQPRDVRELFACGPRGTDGVTGGETSAAINSDWLLPRTDWGLPYIDEPGAPRHRH